MKFNHRYWAIVPLILALLSGGCLFRSHKIERQYLAVPLRTSNQAELLAYIDSEADKIQSMQATVDIDTSVGGEKKGTVTDYEEIRGYILARKPSMLRMIGLLPVVRTHAFDMVSDGDSFKLWIPPKNRFVVGQNNVETHNTQHPLENLRPAAIYDALLLQRIDPKSEVAVLENGTEMVADKNKHQHQQDAYLIDVIRHDIHGWSLARKITFSRTDLLPHRQIFYNEDGSVATDAKYEDYKDYNGVNFPSQIEIIRVQEEYDITLNIVKLDLNQAISDDQFVLEQPPNADVVRLGESGGGGAGMSPAPHKSRKAF
jgi:outer membrane lipoprotein-sorting protein